MSKLDPLTNLPKEETKDPVLDFKQRASRLNTANTDLFSGEGQQVQGAYGTYDPHIRVTSDRNFNELRAQEQGFFELLGKSAIQSSAIAIGGAVEGVGFLGDIPEYVSNLVTGSQQDFERNWLSQIGKDAQDFINERFEIHQTERAQSGTMSRFLDASYWFSHAPSISSTISLMVPAMGAAAAIRGLGSAFNLSRRANQATTTLGTAFVSRHSYNMLESYDVFEQTHQKLLDEGYSDQEARGEAAKAASDMYAIGYANLWKDTLAWGALLRGVNYANRGVKGSISKLAETTKDPALSQIRNVLLKNPGLSVKQAAQRAGFSWRDYVGQATLEGLEEFNIQFQKNWAMKNSDITLGLGSGDTKGFLESYFSGDMLDHVRSAETWDATLFGFLGGATFQGIGALGTKLMDKGRVAQEAKELQKFEAQANRLTERLKAINVHLQEGDTIAAKETHKHMMADMFTGFQDSSGRIVGSAQEGTLGNTREMFEAIVNMSAEEISQLNEQGIEIGDPAVAKEQAEIALAEINKMEEIYNRNMEKVHGTPIDDVINLYIAEQEYLNGVTQDTVQAYQDAIREIYNDPAVTEMLDNMDTGKKAYIHDLRRLSDLRELKKLFEQHQDGEVFKNPYRLKIHHDIRNSTIARINEEIEQLEQSVESAKGPEGFLKSDLAELHKVNRDLGKNEKLADLEFAKLVREYQLSEGKELLGSYLRDETQQKLLEAIQLSDEQLKSDIEQFIVEQNFTDGDIVERDGEYHRVNVDSEGGYTLSPLDQELNMKPGTQPETITDFGEFLDTATKREFDRVLTQKEFEVELANMEKEVQLGNIKEALKIVNTTLRNSNYRNQFTNIREQFSKVFYDHVQSLDSLSQLKHIYDTLTASVSDQAAKKIFRPLVRARWLTIKKRIESEIAAFNEMLTDKQNEATEILKQLEQTENKISELNSHVEQFKQKLRDTAERKNRTQKSILETHKALRRDLNNAQNEVAEELKELKTFKRKLKYQLKDINKSLSVYNNLIGKLKDTKGKVPTGILQSDLDSMLSDLDRVRAETLVDFNLTEYGLNKLQDEYNEAVRESDKVEYFLENIGEILSNLGKMNDIAYQAAEDAIATLKEEIGFESEEYLFNNSDLDRFFQLYNQNITQYVDGSPREVLKLVQNTRLSNVDRNTIEEYIEANVPESSEINEAAERLRSYIPAVSVYESVIQAMNERYEKDSESVEPEKTKTSSTKSTITFKNPKRTPENVFKRLAGDWGDTEKGVTSDPAQRRYANFVLNHDINNMASDMLVEFSTPELADIDVSGLPEFYNKDEVLFALITDKDGNYFTEDGKTTPEFKADRNIYTTVPLASYHSHRMSKTYSLAEDGSLIISDKELNRVFPNETNKERAIQKYENYLEKLKEEHAEFRAEIFDKLSKGEKVTRPVLGKSNGVPNELKNKEGKPRKLTTLFNKEHLLGENPLIELEVATSDTITISGETYGATPGSVIAKDTQTGNVFPLHRRNLLQKEIKTVIEAFKHMAENSEIVSQNLIKTKVEIPGITKTLKGETTPVYAGNILRNYVYALSKKSDIQFVQDVPGGSIQITNSIRNEKGEVTDIETNTIPIFAKKDGKFINKLNPVLVEALESKLSTLPIQVDSAQTKNSEVYDHFVYEDGEFKHYEYKTYTDYLVENDVVGHYIKDTKDTVIVDGTEQSTEESFTHYNQNVYYDNVTVPTEVTETGAETTAPIGKISELVKLVPEENTEIIVNTPGSAASYKISFTDEYEVGVRIPEDFDQRDKAVESARKMKKKLNEGKFEVLDSLEVHPDSPLKLVETTVEEVKPKETKEVQDADSALSEWENTKTGETTEGEQTDDSGFADDIKFQRTSTGRILSEKEVNRLSSNLTDRIGIPINILNVDRSLYFLNDLKERGIIKESFTAENLPKGMYYKGVAYVFNNGEITSDTPFHEVSHPIVNQIISDNPVLFDNLKNEINNTPAGQKIKDRILDNYPDPLDSNGELTTSAWAEIVTTAIGEQASDKYYGKANESLSEVIKRLWNKVVEFIKNIIGRPDIEISSLSTDTTISDIANILANSNAEITVTPSLVPQYQRGSVFSGTIRGSNNLTGKDSAFTHDTMRLMDYVFFRALFEAHSDKIPSLFSDQGLNKNQYDAILGSVKKGLQSVGDTVADRVKNNPTNRNVVYLKNFSYVLKNFPEVINLYEKYLAKYNLEQVTDETFNQENTKDSNELWQTEGLKYSSKYNATSSIRMLIASLNTKTAGNSTFNMPFNVDFGVTFNLLANQLSGLTTLSEMKAAMENTLYERDGIPQLLDRLIKKVDQENLDDLSMSEVQTLLEFRKTFAKNFNKYGVMFSGEDGFSLKDANATTTARRLVERWQSNITPSNPNFTVANDVVVYNLKGMKDRGLFNANSLTNADYLITKADQRKPKAEQAYLKAQAFLEELGIEISTTETSGAVVNRVGEIYNSMRLTTSNTYTNILSAESDHKENLFKVIIPHEVSNSLDVIENSHVRPTGENIYNVNLFSYLTYVANKINRANNIDSLLDANPHLNTPYQQSSLILNIDKQDGRASKMFNSKGERVYNNGERVELEIVFVDTYKNDKTTEANTFDNLSHSDQTLITLNGALNNTHPILRAGDNSNERHIRFPEFFTGEESKKGEYVQYLEGYLQDEISEIQRIRDSENKYLNVPTDIDSLMQSFPIIELFAGNRVLKSEIKRAIEGKEVDLFSARNRGFMRVTAVGFIQNQVEQTKEYLIEKNIISQEGKQYKNNGILGITTTSEFIREDILNRQLSKALTNRLFANVEQTKLFTGPLAYYKNADDVFKRMAGIVGTKDQAAAGHFENRLINKFYPRNNSKRLYKSIERGEVTEAFTNYNEGAKPIIRAAVFGDVKVKSKYLDALPSDISKEAYEMMDETDAIGFISLDGYRDFMIRTGNWDMYKERLYQWETRPSDRKSLTFKNWYTGKTEQIKSEKDLVNADGERTVFNMAKPQYFGPSADNGFIPAMYKTAWLPLLPSYRNQEGALRDLIDHQRKNDIDLVTFTSANKVGAKLSEGKEASIYNKEGKLDFSQSTTQDSWFEYWGNQLSTGNKVKREVTKGSQMMKLIDSNIYDRGQAPNEQLAQLAGEMKSVNNALIQKGIAELKDRLDLKQKKDGEYTIKSIENLMDFLTLEARKRDANSNVLDSFEMLKDHWHQTNMGFDIMSNRDKIENILASIADSMVISQKMPGGSKVQSPVTFFEGMFDQETQLAVDGVKRYSIQDLKNNRDKIYIFGDNLQRTGRGGQAVIRNEPNAFGIATKKAPSNSSSAFMTDSELIENKKIIDSDIQKIKDAGKRIVFPKDGLGTGLAKLSEKAPKTYSYLKQRLLEEFGFNNDTGDLGQGFFTKIVDGKRVYNKKGEMLSGTLKFYDKEGVMEVLLPHHFKGVFADLTASEIDQRLRKGIGFRIPTSGMNSIEHIKVVGYLPQTAGETIIVPSEIVAKAGSDFDVDKLNVYLPNYKIVDGKPEYVEYNSESLPSENSREQLENRMMEIMGEIVSHSDNRSQLLESIGNDLIKAQETHIINKLNLDVHQRSNLDVVGNFPYYMDVTRRNIESKKLTGVAALHTADHSHATRYGYKMNEKHKIKFDHNEDGGLISLGDQTNVDGVKISSILNQLLNTAVDGAKEPIFFNLNMNLQTADVVFYLARAGVGLQDIFEFVNQPIIREFTKLEDIRSSVSDNNMSRKDNLTAAREKYPKQVSVLREYNDYKDSAQVLSNYMQGTRLDTESVGKNTSELDLILHKANEIYNNQSGIINADKLLKQGGFLNTHYRSMQDISDMYDSFFLTKTDGVGKEVYDNIVNHIANKRMTSEKKVKILDKAKSDYITSVVVTSPIQIQESKYGPMKNQFDLVTGSNSVAKRVKKYLENTEPQNQNGFLKAINPIIGKYRYNILGQDTFVDGIKLFDQRKDTIDTNRLVDDFRELFTENNQLAHDLVRLAFLQGGLQFNPMNYMKFIPAEIYMQVVDSAYKNKPNMSSTHFLRNFFINNYNDPDIVPTRYGRYTPDSFIYKEFAELNLTKEEKEARKKLNRPTRERTPRIYIKKKADKEAMNLFGPLIESNGVSGSRLEIIPNAIRDNTNNTIFVYYGNDLRIKQSGEEVQIGDKTTSRAEARELTKYCKS